jgi:hypothetical protein
MQKGQQKNCEKKVTPKVEAKVRAAEDTPIRFRDLLRGSFEGDCK